jgi:hypothetical protein
MQTHNGLSANDRDWFAEFPEEQGLMLDPPLVLSRPSATVKADRTTGQPTHSSVAHFVEWLFGRVARTT